MRFPRIHCGVTTSYEARENAASYLVRAFFGGPGAAASSFFYAIQIVSTYVPLKSTTTLG